MTEAGAAPRPDDDGLLARGQGITLPRVLSRPESGWSSLLVLLGMLALVGLSISDARPLLIDKANVSASLPTLMIAAGLVGFVLARSSLGIVRAHVIGASVAALLLLLVASAAVSGSSALLLADWSELTARLEALYAGLQGSLAADAEDSSVPRAATFLLLGALCWTSGQFSAFSVFRYERAGPAVMATGVLLFLDVAIRSLDPEAASFPLVVLLAAYSLLAMLLLLRLQLRQQGRQWARRHIADTGEVSRLFLRTGTLFVALTVTTATSLTIVAAAPRPDIDAGQLEDHARGLTEHLASFLSWMGVAVIAEPRTSFGDEVPIGDQWIQGEGIAFTAAVEGDLRGNYWWGAAFSRFDGEAWTRGPTETESLPAGEPLVLDPEAQQLAPIALRSRITPRDSLLASGTVLGPSEAFILDRDAMVRRVRDGDGLVELTLRDPVARDDAYGVDSLVGDYRFRSATFTASDLRAAGSDYPTWVTERYLEVRPGTIGRLTREFIANLETDLRRAGNDTAYDRAFELQRQLRRMTYDTDISGLCGELGVAECLFTYRQGFCQHFATTMVLALREMAVPSRYVTGYLPGRQREDGTWVVPSQALHAWVEAYFPGYGWVRFDPTPGLTQFSQEMTRFAEGTRASDPPEDEGSTPDDEPDEELEEPVPEPTPSLEAIASDEAAPLGGIGDERLAVGLTVGGLAALVLMAALALLVIRLLRLPGGDGGLAYRGIVSLASRLGHGPHPSQTEYEYAASLSETVPGVRDDLYLVAGARVETAYGQRTLGRERLAALRPAYARIRAALLRRFLRR